MQEKFTQVSSGEQQLWLPSHVADPSVKAGMAGYEFTPGRQEMNAQNVIAGTLEAYDSGSIRNENLQEVIERKAMGLALEKQDRSIEDMLRAENILDLKESFDHELDRMNEESRLSIDARLDKGESRAASKKEQTARLKEQMIDAYIQTGVDDGTQRDVSSTVRKDISRLMDMSYEKLEAKVANIAKQGHSDYDKNSIASANRKPSQPASASNRQSNVDDKQNDGRRIGKEKAHESSEQPPVIDQEAIYRVREAENRDVPVSQDVPELDSTFILSPSDPADENENLDIPSWINQGSRASATVHHQGTDKERIDTFKDGNEQKATKPMAPAAASEQTPEQKKVRPSKSRLTTRQPAPRRPVNKPDSPEATPTRPMKTGLKKRVNYTQPAVTTSEISKATDQHVSEVKDTEKIKALRIELDQARSELVQVLIGRKGKVGPSIRFSERKLIKAMAKRDMFLDRIIAEGEVSLKAAGLDDDEIRKLVNFFKVEEAHKVTEQEMRLTIASADSKRKKFLQEWADDEVSPTKQRQFFAKRGGLFAMITGASTYLLTRPDVLERIDSPMTTLASAAIGMIYGLDRAGDNIAAGMQTVEADYNTRASKRTVTTREIRENRLGQLTKREINSKMADSEARHTTLDNAEINGIFLEKNNYQRNIGRQQIRQAFRKSQSKQKKIASSTS